MSLPAHRQCGFLSSAPPENRSVRRFVRFLLFALLALSVALPAAAKAHADCGGEPCHVSCACCDACEPQAMETPAVEPCFVPPPAAAAAPEVFVSLYRPERPYRPPLAG